MTYKEFKKKYNGKYTDFDGYYGYQCWDLAQRYFTEVLKVPSSVLSGCGNVCNMLHDPKRKALDKYFEEVKTPKQGDVAIWGGGNNHIAVYDHAKDYYFSQNPNPCKVMKIAMSGVHYFRLKKQKPKVSYYNKYTGKSTSIVDALASLKVDSSFKHRQKIAKANGIKNYVGTPKQNLKMLDMLKKGILKVA